MDPARLTAFFADVFTRMARIGQQTVQRFSDDGTHAQNYYQRFLNPIECQRTEERRKVDKHYEKFAEQFKSFGVTKRQYVERFDRMQKNADPAPTADDYIAGTMPA
jgi:hypothetical protein